MVKANIRERAAMRHRRIAGMAVVGEEVEVRDRGGLSPHLLVKQWLLKGQTRRLKKGICMSNAEFVEGNVNSRSVENV